MSVKTIRELRDLLPNPGTAYRSLPFWGWNDRLDPGELERQLRDMKQHGMGGAFIHSREGLETPYLSDEWMDLVFRSARVSREEGLRLWIYDEDKWPSGHAGGMVAAQNPERYAAKGLTLEILPAGEPLPEEAPGAVRVAETLAERSGRQLLRVGSGNSLLVFRMETSRPSEWYNGSSPADCLSREAMDTFIRLTHARYQARFGGRLEEAVEGFFTDEPNCFDFFSAFTPGRPWLPWTGDFADAFLRRRGYDLIPWLWALFFDGEGAARPRHDYWRTLTELFGERCLGTMRSWCDENHLRLTGHMLYENDLGYNIRVCGAAMPQYRYLHAPGIDLLGAQTREYLTVKQAVSAARQYGRDLVISETYGCTGWEFDFETQKWLGDWQFVQGITCRCQHLAEVSVSGCRKRDYPPVFNYQNTAWPYNKPMEDYFARLSACCTAGKPAVRLLVLHPISSFWTRCTSAPDENLENIEMNMGWKDPQFTRLNRAGEAYNRLAESLARNHWDFDFGDETIISEEGAVENQRFRIGQGSYDTVIVPPVTSLFASTLALLTSFLEAGGRLIWMGDAPDLLEGAPSPEPARVFRHPAVIHVPDLSALLRVLEAQLPDALRIRSRFGTEDEEILAQLRLCGDGAVLIAVNQSRSASREACFCLPVSGSVTAYDPWEDRTYPLSGWETGQGVSFLDTLPSAGSRVYFVDPSLPAASAPGVWSYIHPHHADEVFQVLGPAAAFHRDAPNALTLDCCRFSLSQAPFSDIMQVWQAQKQMREKLGWQQVYYNGAPQRYTWLDRTRSLPGVPFSLAFECAVETVPQGDCFLVVEKPDGLRLTANGAEAENTGGWYLDRAWIRFRLPPLLPGKNLFVLSGLYTPERELEDVYLLGNFGVSPEGHLVREPKRLVTGDCCLQGYPHYAGNMRYLFRVPPAPEGRRVLLRTGEIRGICAEVLVNGVSAGLLFGRCRDTMDLTPFLTLPENRLELCIVASPRNLLGPLHQAYNGCSRISWADFRTEGVLYSQAPTLVPFGMMERAFLLLAPLPED